MKRKELDELHYITPIANAPGICKNGILSSRRAGKLPHQSVAMQEVQDLRAKVVVPGGRPLHEYANLYKLADLFVRVNTRQAEVSATVHFAAVRLAKERGSRPTELDVLTEVMRWKLKRRPPVSEAEVAVTIRNLSALGWLDVEPSRDLPLNEDILLGA